MQCLPEHGVDQHEAHHPLRMVSGEVQRQLRAQAVAHQHRPCMPLLVEQCHQVVGPPLQADCTARRRIAVAAQVHADHVMPLHQRGVFDELRPARQVAGQPMQEHDGREGRVACGRDPVGNGDAIGPSQRALVFRWLCPQRPGVEFATHGPATPRASGTARSTAAFEPIGKLVAAARLRMAVMVEVSSLVSGRAGHVNRRASMPPTTPPR